MISVPQKKKPQYSLWRLYREFIYAFVVEVFTKSSAHGYFQIVQKNRHPSEIIMWSLAIICAIITAIFAGLTTLYRHWLSPTVISVERDYYSWNSSFPSVTICPHDKIDEILLQQYVKYKYFSNSMASNKTELEIFLRSLANAKFDSFEDVPIYPDISSNDYLKILLEITSTMEHTITTADGRELTFQKTVTEMGICFTINSLISDYQSPEYCQQLIRFSQGDCLTFTSYEEKFF